MNKDRIAFHFEMLTSLVLLTLAVCLITVNNVHCATSFQTGRDRGNSNQNLLFSDEFHFLDFTKWSHEKTLSGSGNWEFQWYTNNRTNSFVEDGKLYIKPTLTVDHLGEQALTSMLDLNGGTPADYCTDPRFYGCVRTGTPQNILNPVKSAKIRTVESFNFKFGRVAVRAKLPSGDWLWPAISLLPRYNVYGEWPASGEIDILQSRGNRNLTLEKVNIGNQRVASTLHWGPDQFHNEHSRTHWEKELPNLADDFHIYELAWTERYIQFLIDGKEFGKVIPPPGNFWEIGKFAKTNLANPWKGYSKMAPFDQEFYLVINLAVGGTAHFPDDAVNPTKKPWENNSTTAATDFWDGRSDWLPTWNLDNTHNAAFQVDYIRVYRV